MNREYKIGQIVQFNEKHKWRGSLGFIAQVKKIGDDYRIMIACTIPDNQTACNTAYVHSMTSQNEFELLLDGCAVLMPGES